MSAQSSSRIFLDYINESNQINLITDLESEISNKIDISEKGAPSGVTPLNALSKIDEAYLPNSVKGGIKVIGFWDASTNTPDISLLSLTNGEAYQVSVSGGTTLNGESNWNIKDLAIWSEDLTGNWFKLDNTDDVLSVNGRTGEVTILDSEIESGYNNQVPIVSQAEAELGTSTDIRRWNALRVSQAIIANSSKRVNYVLVKSKSDLPVPILGVIQLADNTTYELNGTINLGTDYIQLGVSNIILGVDKSDDIIIYTGADAAIRSSAKDFTLKDFTITNLNTVGANCIDFIGNAPTQTNKYELSGLIFANTLKVGDIKGGFNTEIIKECLFTGIEDGISITLNGGTIAITDNLYIGLSGTPTCVSIGEGERHTVIISRNMFEVSVGMTALNISKGLDLLGGGVIQVNTFENGGTYLSGISNGDERWLIPPRSNANLAGLLFMTPFKLVTGLGTTTSSVLATLTNALNLRNANVYQPDATRFKSGFCNWYISHDQSGQTMATCLWNNTDSYVVGFGMTGKYNIADITYLGNGLTRYTFDNKDGELVTEPYSFANINPGETATFENCSNVSNNGSFIIENVNDVGVKYLDVFNTNRIDATDDEVASPGQSYGGSVIYRVITTGGVFELVSIPSVELYAIKDYRAGIRRVTISGGNPLISIDDGEEGYITTTNF